MQEAPTRPCSKSEKWSPEGLAEPPRAVGLELLVEEQVCIRATFSPSRWHAGECTDVLRKERFSTNAVEVLWPSVS